MAQRHHHNLGLGRAFKYGALAGLAVALVGTVVFGGWVIAHGGFPGEGDNDVTSALIMVGLPDENGDLVVQAIARVDGVGTSSPSIFSVDPTSSVTVVGTSYSKLRDAYAFGGGARVAEAYSRLYGEQLPFIDYGPDAIESVVEKRSGITIDIPADMSIFDGERLYTFAAGTASLDAEELRAVLNGAAYLAADERRALLTEVERAAVELTANYPGGLVAGIENGAVLSDLSEAAVSRVAKSCGDLQ